MMKPTFDPFPKLDVAPLRFSVYIDGYNLYGAVNHPKPDHLLGLGWCNYQRLGELLVEKSFDRPVGKSRVEVKYFTAKVDDRTARKGEIRRQEMWLKALVREAPHLNDKTIKWGIWSPAGGRKEKKTDVNVVLEIVRDTTDSKPAGIVLVSGDLDFQPVVEYVLDSGVPIAVFTPDEHSPYSVTPGKDTSRVRFAYLTQDLLEQCRLKSDFRPYLTLKVESQPEFGPCLDYERRRHK